ncbi:hypothetical protein, partial [uncultured Dialister sp.]|uniref:hypothetical protein n=1 Tax=uncultured Dialister sp. TaxID=278064 RepID=UPI002621F1DE
SVEIPILSKKILDTIGRNSFGNNTIHIAPQVMMPPTALDWLAIYLIRWVLESVGSLGQTHQFSSADLPL